MGYQETIKKVVKELYDVTKAFATSRHYTVSYWWVESNFGLDLSDTKVRDDVYEMSYSNEFADLIQTIDFDDDKKEVLIMIWASNNKKRYTLKNWKEFCNDALVMPPFEDDEQLEEWFDTHKIHITANNCVMELEYDADAVNEIEFALQEINEAINGDGVPTTGNMVGSEYPSATWKDILKLDILRIHEEENCDYKYAIANSHKHFDTDHFYKTLIFAEQKYDSLNTLFKVNFLKLDSHDLYKIFFEGSRYTALRSILCSKIDIEELYDKDGHCADKVVITDYSIKPSGHLVGWHYGVDWDKDSEDNQYYIQNYIEEMLK